MEIEAAGKNEITLKGNIRSIRDYLNIKEAVSRMVENGAGRIDVKAPESCTITSSVIEFLTKVILQDKVKITFYVGNCGLYGLLEELELIDTLNVVRAA